MARHLKTGVRPPRETPADIAATVDGILGDIAERGEAAVRDHSRRLDDWDPPSFRLTDDQIAALEARVPAGLRSDIAFAADRVRAFAEAQLATLTDLDVELLPGLVTGHRLVPVGSVGCYVPGGRYRLISSALMSVLTASVAGVPRVVCIVAPGGALGVSPAAVHAARLGGAHEIVVLGGVQALAALATGALPDVPPVDMIVGAGNSYVAEAKRRLFGRVGIDLLAGPTEILVIADDTADPRRVAIDLLSQAEHGPTSPAALVTTSESLGRAVLDEIDRLLPAWPTREVAAEAWAVHGSVVVAADREEAAALSDDFAPEHLELQVADPDWFHRRLRDYGSLFIGEHTTVTFGDKAAGPNHTLPTQGGARYTGGLWVGSFVKVLTYQRATRAAGAVLAGPSAAISDAEGLAGHALAARERLTTPPRPSAS